MCLSLSMIWLITGSGGLLLRDSEPGCSRFRPGPENLMGQDVKKSQTQFKLFLTDFRNIGVMSGRSKQGIYHHLVLIR